MNASSIQSLLLYVAPDANADDDTLRMSRVANPHDDLDSEPIPDTEPSPVVTPPSGTRRARFPIMRR